MWPTRAAALSATVGFVAHLPTGNTDDDRDASTEPLAPEHAAWAACVVPGVLKVQSFRVIDV